MERKPITIDLDKFKTEFSDNAKEAMKHGFTARDVAIAGVVMNTIEAIEKLPFVRLMSLLKPDDKLLKWVVDQCDGTIGDYSNLVAAGVINHVEAMKRTNLLIDWVREYQAQHTAADVINKAKQS